MVGPAQSRLAGARRPSDRILEEIADAEGTDPMDFDRRLYDVVDPDALDSLIGSDGADVTITFTYLGYDVTVHSDSAVDLTPIEG